MSIAWRLYLALLSTQVVAYKPAMLQLSRCPQVGKAIGTA